MEIFVIFDRQEERATFDEYFERHSSPTDSVEFIPKKEAVLIVGRRAVDVFILKANDTDEDLQLIHEMLPHLKKGLLIVVGPTLNAKFVLKIQNISKAIYVDSEELESDLPRILIEHRSKNLNAGSGRIVSFLGLSGGCGVSTISVGCAVESTRKVASNALLDLNLPNGDASALLDLRPDYSVADFCRNISRMDETMFSQCFTSHENGLDLLAAPLRYSSIDDVTAEGVDHLLAMVRQRYSMTFVDVNNNYSPLVGNILRNSDMIICVMRQDFISLRHASKTLGFIDDQGIPENRLAFVMSRTGQSGELALKEVEEALKLKVSVSIPEDPRSVNWGTNHGDPVVSSRPHSPSSRAIQRLLDRIESFLALTRD